MSADRMLGGLTRRVLLRGAVLRLAFERAPRQCSSCFGYLDLGGRTDTLKRFSSFKNVISHLLLLLEQNESKNNCSLRLSLCSRVNTNPIVRRDVG